MHNGSCCGRPTLGSCLLVGIVSVFYLSVQFASAAQINMSQVENGKRAIGAHVEVFSEISDGGNLSTTIFQVQKNSEISDPTIASLYITEWYDSDRDIFSILGNFPHLNLSNITGADETRKVKWYFSELPESYNGLNLSTIYYPANGGSFAASLKLSVAPCQSPMTMKTVKQDSTFNITAQTYPYFNYSGNCTCNNERGVLSYANGTQFNGTAICDSNAEWVGCESLQCWSGPWNILAHQINRTAGARDPFNCSYDDGFPASLGVEYELGNKVEVPNGYVLRSSDNGKNLTCEVLSNFSSSPDAYVSPPKKITVYFSPENLLLSPAALEINLTVTESLNFSVSANPELGTVNTTIDGTPVADTRGVFTLKYNFSEDAGTRYIYVFDVFVGSYEDYGDHKFCSSTEKPFGNECIILTISSTDPDDLGLSPAIIAAISVGAILIVAVIGLVIWFIRRKKVGNKGIDKEERMNELYDSVPCRAASSKSRPESVGEERANVLYGPTPASNDDVKDVVAQNSEEEGAVELNLPPPEQPDPSNMPVYSQVDLSHRRAGNPNQGFKAESPVKSEVTEQSEQPQDSTVVHAVVDTSDKDKNNDPSGPVYACVDKPSQSG